MTTLLDRQNKINSENAPFSDDYASLADLSENVRLGALAAIVMRAMIGKGKGLNEVLILKDLIESLGDD